MLFQYLLPVSPFHEFRRIPMARLYLYGLMFVLAGIPGHLLAQTHVRTLSVESFESLTGFGRAVAVGDGEFFVGEPLNERSSGIVYVYRPGEDGVWVESAQLTASDGAVGDRFGEVLAVDEGTLVVTATRADSSRGAAYVFEKNPSGNWVESARLSVADLVGRGQLGTAVDVDENTILLGAGEADGRNGATYVFERDSDPGSWRQTARLSGTDTTGSARFGAALALSGQYALVGAPGEEYGAVYRFTRDAASGVWQPDGNIEGKGLEVDSVATRKSEFGYRIDMHGDMAAVSAPLHDQMTGVVFVYRLEASTGEWVDVARLRPFDPTPRVLFGLALSWSGSDLWVGAPGASGFSGAAYVLSWNEERATWDGVQRVVSDVADREDFFAGSISSSDSLAVVGVYRDDYGAGTALTYNRTSDGSWAEGQKVFSEIQRLEAVTGGKVACDGGEAGGFDCNRVDLLSFVPVHEVGGARGVQLNDVWGWTDPETGKEYALVGRVDGTSFVDVSDPFNPVFLGDLPKTDGVPGNVWRDIKVYQNYAFIVADGSAHHGMQVLDLRQLRDVQSPPVLFKETARYDKIHSAHNIVINEETGFAYTVGGSSGGETCGGGLHMIDIRDPLNPTFAGCFSDPSTGRRNTGYTHDAQCVVYRGPDPDYTGREICFGANETALSIADVTDKANPVAVSSTGYPNSAYTHQGWLTEDQSYFFVNDELDEINGYTDGTRTLVWDVSDLDDPQLAAEHVSENKASDHNLYIRGNTLYQSNYKAGLRMLDVSTPEKPQPVGHFDTVPFGDDSPGFDGSWSNYPFFKSGIIVVTSGAEGLFVLKKQDVGI
jgi:choice-of-anchor B domain-containing protein